MRFGQAFALASLFLVLVISCSSTDELAKAQLTAGCLIDSDCTSPFVCAFKTCHQPCNTSADCKDPPGSRCVTSGRPFNVCEAPTACSFNTQCPGTQVCGIDDLCRDQCRADKDCTVGQKCVDLTCADPTELTDGGLISSADGGTNEGQPCSYNSDCAAPLFCRAGYCSFQCRADVDCTLGETCVKNICTLRASDGGACVPASCGDLGKNCGTILDGCGGTVTCASGANLGCGNGQSCGGGGPNLCGTNACTPQGCVAGACGVTSDGCASVADCGGCPAGQTCGGSGKTEPVRLHAEDLQGRGARAAVPFRTAAAARSTAGRARRPRPVAPAARRTNAAAQPGRAEVGTAGRPRTAAEGP